MEFERDNTSRIDAPVDAHLAQIERDVLGLVRGVVALTADRRDAELIVGSLQALGMASLAALALQYQLDARYGVILGIDVLLSSSVRDVARAVAAAGLQVELCSEEVL